MSRTAVYLPEAEDDVYAAYAHYEGQHTGLGDAFLNAMRDTVARIENNPQIYGVIHLDVRAAALRRFPYVVYFRDRGSDVLIVAIQHGRRSASSWRTRV